MGGPLGGPNLRGGRGAGGAATGLVPTTGGALLAQGTNDRGQLGTGDRVSTAAFVPVRADRDDHLWRAGAGAGPGPGARARRPRLLLLGRRRLRSVVGHKRIRT